jgi:hypothetical protein
MLATELVPDPGWKLLFLLLNSLEMVLVDPMWSTEASESFSLLIRKHNKETMTLDNKATMESDPITPAKTMDPMQIVSSSSNRGSKSRIYS